MMRYLIMMVVFTVGLTGCARYNTHKGRVGPPQTPSPLSQPQQAPVQAVTYGSAPVNRVPELVQPVTRTVWIKGYQRRPGEYVGDYPLTLIYTQADFIQPEPPAVAIPHAIQSDGGTAGGTTRSDVQRGNPEPHPSIGASTSSSADETLRRYLEQAPRPPATGVPATPDATGRMVP